LGALDVGPCRGVVHRGKALGRSAPLIVRQTASRWTRGRAAPFPVKNPGPSPRFAEACGRGGLSRTAANRRRPKNATMEQRMRNRGSPAEMRGHAGRPCRPRGQRHPFPPSEVETPTSRMEAWTLYATGHSAAVTLHRVRCLCQTEILSIQLQGATKGSFVADDKVGFHSTRLYFYCTVAGAWQRNVGCAFTATQSSGAIDGRA